MKTIRTAPDAPDFDQAADLTYDQAPYYDKGAGPDYDETPQPDYGEGIDPDYDTYFAYPDTQEADQERYARKHK